MLRRGLQVIAFFMSMLFAGHCAAATDVNTTTYNIYLGDVNGDGYSDYYFVPKPLFVLLHGDIVTPLLIKGTSFAYYRSGDTYSAAQSYSLPDDQLAVKISTGQFKLAQLNVDIFTWKSGSLNNILLRGGDASAPAVLLANPANDLFPTIAKAYSSSTYIGISDRNIALSIVDVNGDGKNDILLGSYNSNSAQAAYLSDGAGVPVKFFEVTPATSRPVVAATQVGSTIGKFRVDESGAATYNIPISIPDGIVGVTPQLSINYSSQDGAGLLGKGWSLGGISSISRCRQTLIQDGFAKAITWSSSDRFCLDGQRLILVSGSSYGAVGSTYKTEIDTFVTVTANGGSSGHPSYFTVTAKDGSTSTYGNTTDSKTIGSNAAPTTTVLSWGINRFEDSVKNGIDYVYEGDATTGVRLRLVNYAFTSPGTSNNPASKVVFDYGTSDRPDPSSSYIAGYEFKQTKRLNSIKVINGATELRTFNLSYMGTTTSDSRYQNKISRLENIQECKGTSCLPPITFTWGGGSHVALDQSVQQTNFIDSTAGKYTLNNIFADVTGDGKVDLIYLMFESSQGTSSLPNKAQISVHIKYAQNVVESNISLGTVNDYNDIKISTLDYNADGRQDLAIYNGTSWKIYLSTPRANGNWEIDSASTVINDSALTNKDTVFVDINSDGLADAVTSNSYRLLTRNGLPNSSSQAYSFGTSVSIVWDALANFAELNQAPGYGFPCTHVNYTQKILPTTTTDFNGDGVVDFIGTYTQLLSCTVPGNPNNPTAVSRSYNYALAYRDGKMTNYGQVALATPDTYTVDLNGDGLSDLVYSDSNNKYYYKLNNGAGFNAPVYWLDLPLYSSSPLKAIPQFIDFNGDGATDIVWNNRSLNTLNVRLWGSDQSTVVRDTFGSATDSHLLMDVSGDGIIDYIKITSSSLSAYRGVMAVGIAPIPCHNISIPVAPYTVCVGGVASPSAAVPDNEQNSGIISIANGLGDVTKIKYGTLSNSGNYTTTDVNATVTQTTYPTNCYSSQYYCPPTYSYTVTEASSFYSRLNGGWDLPSGSSTLVAGNTGKGAPVIEVNGAMGVVTSVSSNAPAAGATPGLVSQSAMSTTNYFYGEAKMQASGRGFLGFSKFKMVDVQTGITTAITYRQDFPFTGSPLSTVTYVSDSPTAKVLNRVDNTWGFKAFSGADSSTKLYQPIITSSVEKTYDLNSSTDLLIQSVTTNSVVDDFGNTTQLTVATTGSKPDGNSTTQTKVTNNTFGSAGVSDYNNIFGRLTQTIITTTRDADPSQTRTSTFSYYGDNDSNGAKGLLKTEVLEPGSSLGSTKEIQYDKFGHTIKSITTAINSNGVGESRIVTSTYDQSNGRDLLTTKNNLNQQVNITSRNEYGEVTTGTDFNSIGSQVFYDDFGIEYMRKDDTGAWTRTESNYCGNGITCPTGAVYRTTKRASGGSSAIEYYDLLGRVIRSSKVSFDGRMVNIDSEYDNLSRIKRQSTPYYDGSAPSAWTENEYDLIGRVKKVTQPDGTVNTTAYTGYTTTLTNPLLQTRTETRNGLNQLVKVTDYKNGTIDYEYDLQDNLLKATTTADGVSVSVRMCYDTFGRKIAMFDPDKGGFKGNGNLTCSQATATKQVGWWYYSYDGFGELISQSDPKNQVTNMVYDKLGRMIGRTDILANGAIEGFTQWFYEKGTDGSGAPIQGKLTAVVMNTDPALTLSQINTALVSGLASCSQASISCHKTLYNFDIFARPLDTTVYYPGSSQAYISRVSYDLLGRTNRLYDALDLVIGNSSSGVQTSYNDYGYVSRVNDIGSGDLLQQTLATNERGQILSELRGNGVTSTNTYDNLTGQLTDQQAGIGSLFNVQNIHYKWDSVGNLKYRDNQTPYKSNGGGTKNLKESFCYDGLNRLIKTVSGVASASPNCSGAVDVFYDGLGNITGRMGLGSFTYGSNAGPHAITASTGDASVYTYDNNGNQISGAGRTLVYTTYDQPTLITKNGVSTTFTYGPDRSRWQRKDVKNGVTTVTTYLGNVEKIEVLGSGFIEWKRYVSGAIYTYKTNTSNQLQSNGSTKSFVYNDHLGSLDVITDSAGVIQQSLSFDPWGARRNGENWNAFSTTELSLTGFTQPISTHGFTGHEMVDDMGLIHMNGRIYDPKIARFLQTDPFIQAATNTQNFNRYSYVMNNPLNATDPSGFFFKGLRDAALPLGARKIHDQTMSFTKRVIAKYGIGGAVQFFMGDFVGASLTNKIDARIAQNKTASQVYIGVIGIVSAVVCGPCTIGFTALASANMAYYQTRDLNFALEVGARAGAVAAISYGVSGYYGNTWNMERVFVSSVAGGVSAEISGGSFQDGFRISAVLSLMTLANYKMREAMIKQSELNPDNMGKDSDGFFGDKKGLAGTRRVLNPKYGTTPGALKYLTCDGPAGGCQGPQIPGAVSVGSRLGPISYPPGSFFDTLAESFAGPHDWLSDQVGMYDVITGNGISRSGFMGGLYETMSYGLIPVASPFSVAALIETTPGATNLLYSRNQN